ncbi:MAG: PKD domain-containing protein, partial [Actinomycetota bacterium]|nr:PKD domain-containing protein [Actinomycetota bacterium]
VYARRVFGTRLSAAPQELNVATLDGHAGGAADLADVDIEDDSSYAWVVFRQAFDDGRAHVVARRLVGSAFETPVFVDGLGYPAPGDATETVVELNGRGEGIAATSGAGGVNGAIVHEDIFNPGRPLGPGTAVSKPAVGIAENNDAFAAWLPGDGSVQIRPYDINPARRLAPPPGPAAALSRPELGPVVPEGGMDMAVNRAGDASAVFLQEGADGRRLVAGVFDRVPGVFRTFTTAKFRKFARPPLSWQASFDLLGAVKYRVEVDGQPVGETTETKLTPLNPVGDGEHTWRVVAIDRRGQSSATPPRALRVDSVAPQVTFRVTGSRKRAKPIKVAVTAADGSLTAPSGSGIKAIRISWGDKTRVVSGRRASHRYARGGKYTIRVSATDVAGNAVAVTKRITVKKK